MSRFQRKESFRYEFKEPIPAMFKIVQIDEHKVSSSTGEAKIIDLSPSGMRLNSHLKIYKVDDKTIELFISFQLNDEPIDVKGEILWKKNKGMSMDYGITLITDESMERELIFQLKQYARRLHEIDG